MKRSQMLRAVVFGLVLLGALGCQRGTAPQQPADRRAQPAGAARVSGHASSQDPAPGALAGTWRVVRFSAPGVTALTQREAEERIGRTAYFGADSAVFGTERCLWPKYASRTVDADSYFVNGYNTTAQLAQVQPDADGRLRVASIRCDGKAVTPGLQEVFWSGRDTLVADDEGVFLFLRRTHR